jgi:ribosome-binding protein aMBF1 (putative translation factor)
MSSKRCVICKKPWEVIELYEGIYDNEMIMVCEECANEEKIPRLRKPSQDQLQLADKRYSVRERMENMSGINRYRTHVDKDQQNAQSTISRLKMPEPKQKHEQIVDNYYWNLNMARRRKKMTINQVSVRTQIPIEIIEAIEKGKIPKDFEQIFVRLEDFFGIKLLKHHKSKVHYILPEDEEEEILDEVKQKMETTRVIDEDTEFEELDKRQKQTKLKEISEGDLNISDRKQLDEITLNDLVELKRQKEKKQQRQQLRQQTEDLLGDDLDIDFE